MSKVNDKEIFEKWILSKPWLKFYEEAVPKEIDIPEIPLYKFLDDAYKIGADHPAMIFMGRKITYREFYEDSERFGRALVDKFNIKKGDKVAIYLPNTPQFAIAFYGAIKVGAIVTPMNPLYTAREVARQLKDSGAKVLVALDLFTENVEKALEEVDINAVIYTGIEDYMPSLKGWIYKTFMKKVKAPIDNVKRFRFKDVIRDVPPEAPRPDVNPKEDVIALMYTGGTTGVPKGAELTHYNLVSNVLQIDAWLFRGRKKVDKYVGVLPWFHIYGMTTVLHSAIYSVATIIIFPRFDIKELLEGIKKYRPNVFHGVPTIYSLLINYPEIKKYDLSSIEACVSGAGPLPVSVAKKFEEITGGRIREGYGLTETSPVTHVNPIYGKYKFGSIGLPIPNTLAAIADLEEDRFLKPGETGELVISGPQVMKGYYNRPEENKKVFFEKYGFRWLRTGDIAYMDEEGYFYIVDRKKDLIKYKGYSVYPREIEEVLYQHEAVAEAAVIGVPDEKVGERIKAFVVLKNEYRGKVSQDDILSFLKDNLAPYKLPKEIEFRDTLPKSAAGKILRRVLREEEVKKLEGK
ncbi:long-chain fatty acid--CoA ligase [Candidatus Geothermarchaeota archaeon]|nr:MAG: long-chain fatty acid--CoA ligase [Candidatus Geothermarchaeota archaeon]